MIIKILETLRYYDDLLTYKISGKKIKSHIYQVPYTYFMIFVSAYLFPLDNFEYATLEEFYPSIYCVFLSSIGSAFLTENIK